MPPFDRRRTLILAIAWVLATVAIAVSIRNGHNALQAARRSLLLAETSAAASALTDAGGEERVAQALAGRWARSAIARGDLTVAQVAEGDEGLVGRAPVRDAAGSNTGTLVVLERRDVPRGLPAWLFWLSGACAAIVLGLSIATTQPILRTAALALATALVLVASVVAWRAVATRTAQLEVARANVLRVIASAPRQGPGERHGADTPWSAGALAARTLGPGLAGASIWLALASIASGRRARRTS
jgi:hypothetical protein